MIVITGASGDLGQRISQRIAQLANPKDVCLTSRTPENLDKLKAKGFAVKAFDFDDSKSMVDAFSGAKTVLIISGNAPVDVRTLQQRAAVKSAVEAGVERIVYTSFANANTESLFPFAAIHADTEKAIIESGLNYTILRNCQYAENLTGALQHASESGNLSLPSDQGRTSYLLKDDLAEMTVNALLNDSTENKVYDLTGNESYSLSELAAIATQKWDREVVTQKMPKEVFSEVLSDFGLPDFVIEALKGMHDATDAGEYSLVSDDAKNLLGRQPRDIADFISNFA